MADLHGVQTAKDGPPFLFVGFDTQSFNPFDDADKARVLPQLRASTATRTMSPFKPPGWTVLYTCA